MAKRAKKIESPQIDFSSGMMSSLVAGLQQKLQRRDVVVGAPGPVVGLQLPALSLRYLLQTTVYPLGRIAQLTGEEGSCKTAMAHEIMAWHLKNGGCAAVAENEGKSSMPLRASIHQNDLDMLNRCLEVPTTSVEEWQRCVTDLFGNAAAVQTARGGPGRTIPFMVLVDSIMGTPSTSKLDNIISSGHASRGYAEEALLITNYMRTMPRQLNGFPFSLVGTNHLKPSKDAMGLPISNVPGGKSVKFHETLELEMKRLKDIEGVGSRYDGVRVQILARKNSVGASRRRIEAEFIWWNGGPPNNLQISYWDWYAASIDMLLNLANKHPKTFREAMSIVDINTVKTREGVKVWSSALGVAEDDPKYTRELGYMLESRPDLLGPLHQILGISQGYVFTPGADYAELYSKAAAEMERMLSQAGVPVVPAQSEAADAEVADAEVADDPDVLEDDGLDEDIDDA